MTFALHADQRGYTWPGVDHIAFTWRLHRATVRRAISSLLVRRTICRTKQTRGTTGQVKVYRMPRAAREAVQPRPLSERPKRTQSGHKAAYKRSPNVPEQRITNKEPLLVERVLNAVPKSVGTGNSKPYSRSVEQDLLASLSRMLGKREMEKNGAMWRMRIRSGKEHRRAIQNALEDFNLRTPDQQAKIHNRAAWLTDRYERCHNELCRARTRDPQLMETAT
jgi:hypothetical protein